MEMILTDPYRACVALEARAAVRAFSNVRHDRSEPSATNQIKQHIHSPRMIGAPSSPIKGDLASGRDLCKVRHRDISPRLTELIQHDTQGYYRGGRTPQVRSGPVKSSTNPYVFSLRKGLVGSAAAYASAALYVPEEVMTECTWPCPRARGSEVARTTRGATERRIAR